MMKKLLNTLFVQTQGAYLAHDGESVVVRAEGVEKLRVPIHMLGGIVCFGNVAVSSPLLGLCGERGVTVSLLSEHGRFLARVQTQVYGNVLLRRAQYRAADDPSVRVNLARLFVLGKLANARTVLQRALHDHGEKCDPSRLESAIARLARQIEMARGEDDIERLRGIEGEATKTYFNALDDAIIAQKGHFYMRERSRRPPLDNFNALLSFIYTLLAHDATAALETVGLDPQVGYLHAERAGRPALALDLMEELRPFLADRLALSLVSLHQLSPAGFRTTESGGVMLTEEGRKILLTSYQKRKQDELEHPFLQEKVPIGLLPFTQALFLARYLRGDLDEYPPFLWR